MWKAIDGWPGYAICNDGRAKGKYGPVSGTLLRGYRRYGLRNGTLYRQEYAHRLVAQAFIPNPEQKPMVNHINGMTDDNRVENLEWCTNAENMKHAVMTLGRYQKGVSDETVRTIRKMHGDGFTRRQIAEATGMTYNYVIEVILGRRRPHVQ